jgi:hypothetical protein
LPERGLTQRFQILSAGRRPIERSAAPLHARAHGLPLGDSKILISHRNSIFDARCKFPLTSAEKQLEYARIFGRTLAQERGSSRELDAHAVP